MAFWGVEVKPGRPYTHRYEASHGRLRICQATLGNYDAMARTVLQCNVGDKVPIKLCSLNPKLAEMCHLEVEFEEVQDVIFSVIGQSSIHLSGHYVGARGRHTAAADESESYGEDVGQSDTEEELASGEDSYESDFIDDREIISEESHGSDSVQEVSEKPKAARRRRLRKYQMDSTDDDNDDPSYKPAAKRNASSVFNSCSEDEEPVPISIGGKNGSNKVAEEIKSPVVQTNGDTRKKGKDGSAKAAEEIKSSIEQTKDDTGKKSNIKKRKSSAISEDATSPVDITDANASSPSKQDVGSNKKSKKKRKQSEAEGTKQSNVRTLDDGLIVEDLSTGNKDAKMASTGSKVYIKYVGMLKDGKVVESNVNEKPYKFKLGAGKVIRGWDVGISGMRVGDKRRLTVPPSMCYGDKSVGAVPKNASVVYEVELVKVK